MASGGTVQVQGEVAHTAADRRCVGNSYIPMRERSIVAKCMRPVAITQQVMMLFGNVGRQSPFVPYINRAKVLELLPM